MPIFCVSENYDEIVTFTSIYKVEAGTEKEALEFIKDNNQTLEPFCKTEELTGAPSARQSPYYSVECVKD